MTTIPELLFDGPANAKRTVVLAHGAGAAMDTPFMNTIATGLADQEFRVVRFEFPYMAQRRQTGKSRPPDRTDILQSTWQTVIQSLGADSLVIGGKSMGGRIASMLADASRVAGVVALGYPFHPVGKPEQLRIAHLHDMRTPTLILQGERDPFGNHNEVPSYTLGPNVQVHWLPDGDHSFKPRKSSGVSAEQNLNQAIHATAAFCASIA